MFSSCTSIEFIPCHRTELVSAILDRSLLVWIHQYSVMVDSLMSRLTCKGGNFNPYA